MRSAEKKEATAYILLQFAEWYIETDRKIEENDLSILKSLKLFFLLSTVNTDQQGHNLLDIGFNNYIAMPFGPVESSVYDFLKKGEYIDRNSLKYHSLSTYTFDNINPYKGIIGECIKVLKKINFNLINFSASQLVDLTHKYSVWINSYNIAVNNGSSSYEMSAEAIKNEEKFYYL